MNGYSWLYQFQQQMAWQNAKLAELETLVRALDAKLNTLKDTPRTHIDKIEYTFDQLKVEKLEGTLNIGMSPDGEKAIEELSVPAPAGADAAPPGADPAVSAGMPWAGKLPPVGGEGVVSGAVPGQTPAGSIYAPDDFRPAAAPAGAYAGQAQAADIIRQADQIINRYLTEELPDSIERLEQDSRHPLGEQYRRLMIEDLRSQIRQRIAYYAELLGKREPVDYIGQVVERVRRDVDEAVRRHFTNIMSNEESDPS